MAIAPPIPDGAAQVNHPLARRMGVIAGFSHNLIIGCIFGTFSVMIASVEQRMNVSPEQAALGIPLIVIVSSLLSPMIGVMIAKYSLRMLLVIGALLSGLAFLLLAFSTSYLAYLVAYGALLGPAMSLGGSIGPATLVTRWFSQNRGMALGLVHLPVVVAILPVLSNWVLENYGAQSTYLMSAGLLLLVLLPLTLFTVNHPPEQEQQPAVETEHAQQAAHDHGATARTVTNDGSMSVGQLLKSSKFWLLALSASAISTGGVTLGTILIPMAVSWGIERGDAAILASVMSMVGIAGSIAFGWVADKIGGILGLALLSFSFTILWAILLLHPPFPILLVVIGLIGMHGAGMIPNLSRAISDSFGAASFSRGFGLYSTVSLPFTVLAVVGSQAIYSATGTYSGAITVLVGFYAVAIACAFIAHKRP